LKSQNFLIGVLSSLLFFSVPAMSANVVVQKIALESAKQQVQAVGNTEAIHSVVMYPAVGDRVTGVFFKPGDKVKKAILYSNLILVGKKQRLMRLKLNLPTPSEY